MGIMGALSENFSRKEFACKCGCGKQTVDIELIKVLEDVRKFFMRPVIINSGHRCKAHNKKVGGRRRSKHLEGIAADIKVVGILPVEIARYLDRLYPEKYGIKNYETFTHIDIRPNRTRW